jgi:hypothetical protein
MVEGPMTNNPSRIMLTIFILLFISQLPLFSTHATTTTLSSSTQEASPDLLIILSPQYAHDTDILTAIHSYIQAVSLDLGWHTHLIPLQDAQNEYHIIDSLIEATYATHPLKACFMVGEDLNTPLSGDTDYLEQPSIIPWATLGGTTAYTLTTQGILCIPTTLSLCISLLYPTHALPYNEKKASLVTAFQKFTTQRHMTYQDLIGVLESSSINANTKTLYQTITLRGNLFYTQDPTDDQIRTALQQDYTAFFVHGHSTPAGTDVNIQKNSGWFDADNLDTLHTAFFGADGCYVGGWWSNHTDNNILDQSINAAWYGAEIFTSPTLQAMALGLLSQTGFSHPVSFLENVFPKLLQGKTLAEAITGEPSIGDYIIVGDPTFHIL